MAGTTVIARDGELGSIESFLAEIEWGPAALVLAGEAGIGKTVLWEAGVEQARRRFDHVVSWRGIEAEALLSFAGLAELMAEVPAGTLASLAAPRRRALEVAVLATEPGADAPDQLAIGLAVLDVLRALAARGPLLIAVDDLQWLDSASAGVMQFALRRLRDEPLGLLATVRDAPDAVVPIELERCFDEARLRWMSVSPFSLGALYRLLRDRLGLDLSRPELVRVHEATAGNPFFALEVGRELSRRPARVQPGQPLPVPTSLRRLLEVRLSRLSPTTRAVLLLAACAGRPTIDVLAAAHGNRADTIAALDEAEVENVVELTGDRVHFSHTLFASVLHELAPSRRRHEAHRALAWAVNDIEERAGHLARAAEGPDSVVAAELDAAAELAAARGAPAAGAEMCELAAQLTPADAVLARRRRFRAATFHGLAGDGQRAIALLEQILPEVPSGPERSDILFELASSLRADPRTMIELLGEALAEAGDDDARCVRILCKRTLAHLFVVDAPAALVDARAALASAERGGDPRLLAVALGSVGQTEMWIGDVTPGLLQRGAEIEDKHGLDLELLESPRSALARLLARQGDTERSRAIYEDLGRQATARGDERSRVLTLWMLSYVEWLAGHWQLALGHSIAAHELGEQTQEANERVWVGRMKALVEADLGLVAESRVSAHEGLAIAEAASNEFFTIASLGALGRLELALGNLDAARGYLSELPERLLSRGFNEPTNPVWADSIETLIDLGELEQPRAYLKQYELNAQRLCSPWAIASASRCRGLLAAREGDLVGAVAAIARALAVLDGYTYPFERGRALLALGSVRRQAQQKGPARSALQDALAIFEALGARLWADKARSELRRISGRRPADAQLTETEHQVAVLAAQGSSNREIAATLHMGVSTVESRLSHVYRKLGVRRVGLAAWLTSSSGPPRTS
jgi:DNA-binding CsgD family transcriptional regulator